ncbi:MAG TPA: HPr family phosphocarrier protein [Planctomycetota bacterium]|nr:HPr family phosphocarrier protein [Planctomycetota bacterium]
MPRPLHAPQEAPFEQVIREPDFVPLLQERAGGLAQLADALRRTGQAWNKRHYFQLLHDADELESFLDDHGARDNRTFFLTRELVAGVRGLAGAGYSLAHLLGRLDAYGAPNWLDQAAYRRLVERLERSRAFVQASVARLLDALRAELAARGVARATDPLSEDRFRPLAVRRRLPTDVGHDELTNEGQKVAEVASKFVQTSQLVGDLKLRAVADPVDRRKLLARVCTEEQARVYEASVHNLQSTYDTYIQGTVLEGDDPRLPRLRGYASASLHLLEAVTQLTHFYERHESDQRGLEVEQRLGALVARSEVEGVILNELLVGASELLADGRELAEELLGAYTNVQELEVVLPQGLTLHARPAALIVGIVNHHATPVELQVGARRCNAASILEVLLTVGSQPGERTYVFRGDERPLRHIGLLFEHGLGERGLADLPSDLDYLGEA